MQNLAGLPRIYLRRREGGGQSQPFIQLTNGHQPGVAGELRVTQLDDQRRQPGEREDFLTHRQYLHGAPPCLNAKVVYTTP
jgi:hypothetical protein